MTKRDRQASDYATESYGETHPKRCFSHTSGGLTERLRKWCHAVDAESAQDMMDEAADEIEHLREAIRRLADQDATLSVQGGNVTVTLDATLTDEEREAVEYAELTLRCETHPVCERHTAILRKLMERLS